MGLEKFFQTTPPPSAGATGYRVPAPPKYLAKPARWIPPGETVEVLDYIIRGGMLYVGTGMKDQNGTPEPSLINPICPVQLPSRAFATHMLDYWPSYATLHPEARGTYLNWLASGRDSLDIDMGYVTLYFFGLERRTFIDGYGMPEAAEEWPALRAEVLRLLYRYGSKSFTFEAAAQRYLEMVDVAVNPRSLVFGQSKYAVSSGGLPLAFRKQLGELAVAKEPLTAELALAWAHADPVLSKPTSLNRCRDKFEALFLQKYRDLYKGGLVLPITRTKLMVVYEPASQAVAGFGEIGLFLNDIPDVTTDSATGTKIQAVMHLCAADLDGYSRFIGRNPDKKSSLEAQVLLPDLLQAPAMREAVSRWKEAVADVPVMTSLADVMASFGDDSAEPSREAVYAALGLLFSADVRMEPELTGKIPNMTTSFALFSSEQEDIALREKPEYVAAKAALQMAQLLMLFEPAKADASFAYVAPHIDSWTHLSRPQRKRLKAYAYVLRIAPPTALSVKKSVSALDESTRSGIGVFLCKVAHASGDPSLEAIKELSKYYKILGLTADALHSDLHAAASGTSRPKMPGALDHARIAELQADTAVVGALLANVFQDESAEPAVAAIPAEAQQSLVLGLDAAHSAFARALLGQSNWSREELCNEANKHGLMPDGALEHLNEAAFDAFDMPFVEGDDPYEINPDLAMELSL